MYKILLCNNEFQDGYLNLFSSLPFCLESVVHLDMKNRKKQKNKKKWHKPKVKFRSKKSLLLVDFLVLKKIIFPTLGFSKLFSIPIEQSICYSYLNFSENLFPLPVCIYEFELLNFLVDL